MDRIFNQKGLAPLAIFVIVAVVLAAAGAGWYFTRDEATSPSSTETTEPTAAEREFEGSYADAMTRGEPLHCTWQAPEELADELQMSEGTMYTDGSGRGRTEASYQIQEATAKTTAVFDPEAVYMWTELASGQTIGFKMSNAALTASESELTPEEIEQGKSFRARYQFDCQPWAVDEGVFNPPEGVEFRELG